jgi:Helix-turn-helix domain
MARHRLDRRRVKIHRCYTVEEIARLLGTCRATVRRWLKSGLKSIDKHRPTMVRGADLLEYLTARTKPKVQCPPGHCYCVKCRAVRLPDGAMAELNVLTETTGNLRGLCPDCGTMMYRRMALAQLERVRENLDVTIVEAVRHLKDSSPASPNVHFTERDARA